MDLTFRQPLRLARWRWAVEELAMGSSIVGRGSGVSSQFCMGWSQELTFL